MLLLRLIKDGLLEDSGADEPIAGGAIVRKTFRLTQAGKEYVNYWLSLDRTAGPGHPPT